MLFLLLICLSDLLLCCGLTSCRMFVVSQLLEVPRRPHLYPISHRVFSVLHNLDFPFVCEDINRTVRLPVVMVDETLIAQR